MGYLQPASDAAAFVFGKIKIVVKNAVILTESKLVEARAYVDVMYIDGARSK